MLKKKFSIGLSPFIRLHEYKMLFLTFKDYIGEIYFSPFFNEKLQSRSYLLKEYQENKEEMLEVLKLAKKYGFLLELTINSRKDLTTDEFPGIKEWLVNNKIEIDKVVTFNHLAEEASKFFDVEKITCSYNENIRSYKQIAELSDVFGEVVLGNSFIRDFVAFDEVKKRNMKVKLLINNGCSHNCKWCSDGGSIFCEEIVEKNTKNKDINELFAIQSVMPFELYEKFERSDTISLYKLSTRSMDFKELNRTMEIYVNNINVYKNTFDLGCICKLNAMQKMILKNIKHLSVKKIIEYKKAMY